VKTAAPRAKIAVSIPKKDMPDRKKPKPKLRECLKTRQKRGGRANLWDD